MTDISTVFIRYRLATILPRWMLSIDPYLYVPESQTFLRLERQWQSFRLMGEDPVIVLCTSRKAPAVTPLKRRIFSAEFSNELKSEGQESLDVRFRPFPFCSYLFPGWLLTATSNEISNAP